MLKMKLLIIMACILLFTPVTFAKKFSNLYFMGAYPNNHPSVTNVFSKFMEQAKIDTKGQLSFNYFSTNILYDDREIIEAVIDGRTNFGTLQSGLTRKTTAFLEVIDLPGLVPNAIVGSLVNQEIMDTFPELQARLSKDVKIWTTWVSAPYELHSVQPIRNMEELQGKKVIVWNFNQMAIAKAIGAMPVMLNFEDTHLALAKGMAAGVICPIAPLRSFNIANVCKYHTLINLSVSSFIMLVNQSLWDSMPKNLQDYLNTEGNAKLSLALGKSLQDSVEADTKWMKEQGHEFFSFDVDSSDKIKQAFEEIKANWVREREAEGLMNAAKILKFAEERVKFHSEQLASEQLAFEQMASEQLVQDDYGDY